MNSFSYDGICENNSNFPPSWGKIISVCVLTIRRGGEGVRWGEGGPMLMVGIRAEIEQSDKTILQGRMKGRINQRYPPPPPQPPPPSRRGREGLSWLVLLNTAENVFLPIHEYF